MLDVNGNADGNGFGIRVADSANNRIDGNVLSGNDRSGILIRNAGSTENVVTNNFVGTDSTGSTAVPNGSIGVVVQSARNQIGTAENGNVISGNGRHGVLISGAAATDNSVLANKVGTNAAGTAAIANNGFGVWVNSADRNQIGGADTGAGNTVSGNTRSGVALSNADNSTIDGNRIGTTADGMAAIGNRAAGVFLNAGSTDNTISHNQIAGNQATGVSVVSQTTIGNTLFGNKVGTTADGSSELHNGTFGILIQSSGNTVGGQPDDPNIVSAATRGIVFSGVNATGNTVSHNLVGTDGNGADLGMATGIQIANNANGNTIASNTIANNQTGVRFLGSAGNDNRVTQNSFVDNSVIGIDLAGLGPTANDAGDADEGANRGQNHPVLESAVVVGNNVNVTFSVPTDVANATYDLTIELFK